MAIVSDYMIYGNCKSCGKYLAQGTFCCEGVVQSNYTVWLEDMMNRKKDAPITEKQVLVPPKLNVKFIKGIMEKHGEEYSNKIVEDNNKLRDTYPLAFAKDRNNPAYYHIILTELFNNNLVTLEQYEAIIESIQKRFTKEENVNEQKSEKKGDIEL